MNFQFHGGTDVTQFWAIKGKKSTVILACAAASGRSCVMSMADKGDGGKEGRKDGRAVRGRGRGNSAAARDPIKTY